MHVWIYTSLLLASKASIFYQAYLFLAFLPFLQSHFPFYTSLFRGFDLIQYLQFCNTFIWKKVVVLFLALSLFSAIIYWKKNNIYINKIKSNDIRIQIYLKLKEQPKHYKFHKVTFNYWPFIIVDATTDDHRLDIQVLLIFPQLHAILEVVEQVCTRYFYRLNCIF